MKAIVYISLDWGDRYGQPPKSPEELERDRQRVKEILERTGYGDEFAPDRELYKFETEVRSKVFNTLIEELQTDPHLTGPHTAVWKSYTQQELAAAELLMWGPTNQAIEDDYYDFYKSRDKEGIGPYSKRCSSCATRLEQIRELRVNKALMQKKDVSLTYSNQVILAEWVGRLLQEHGLSGFELCPVHHYKKPYKGEPSLYQLKVTNVLPPMASPPTEFESFHECAICGRKRQFLKRTHWWGKIQYYETSDVYYPRSVLEVVKDLNHTAEWFDDLRVAHPMIIITQRVYRLLREHKVRNWAAVPVYLVD